MTIEQVTVAGSGTMGRGIAYLALLGGYHAVLYDVDSKALEAAKAAIEASFRKGVEKGKLDQATADASMQRLTLTVDLEASARQASVIIEAIPETLELKKEFFSQVDLFCDEETILASNTSSLSITELAGAVERRDRFIGLHFFNPPQIMKLLEIVAGERTSTETIEEAKRIAQRMGKEAIVVRDSPGFATSRLGLAIGLEAIRMLEEGVASAEDIDRAMVLGYNHPIGPLELTDIVGLDVRLAIAEYLASKLGPRFEPPQLLRQMVADGKLGKKSGAGFYNWKDE